MATVSSIKRVLVVSSIADFNLDKAIATVAVAHALAQKYGIVVDIYFDKFQLINSLANFTTTTNVRFIEKLDAEHLTIEIDRKNSRVTGVKWQETADKINLIILTDKGQMEPVEYSISPGKPQFDLVVSLGISQQADINKILGDFATVWTSSRTMNVDLQHENSKFAERNHIYPDSSTYAETAVKIFERYQVAISAEIATDLLTAIYWRTNSLQNEFTTSNVLMTASLLMSRGADPVIATSRVVNNLGILESQFTTAVWNNLKWHSKEIVMSNVDAVVAKQYWQQNIWNKNYQPLAPIRDAKLVLTLLPIGESTTIALVTSNQQHADLRTTLAQYNYQGSKKSGYCEFQSNFADTKEKITELLKSTPQAIEPEPDPINLPIPETITPKIKDATVEEKKELKAEEVREKEEPKIEAEEEKSVEVPADYDPLQPAKEEIKPMPQSDSKADDSSIGSGDPFNS